MNSFLFTAARHITQRMNRLALRLTKDAVQKLHFVSPIFMRTLLSLWEEETLSRIETSPHIAESTVFPRDLNDTVKAQKIERGAARLED